MRFKYVFAVLLFSLLVVGVASAIDNETERIYLKDSCETTTGWEPNSNAISSPDGYDGNCVGIKKKYNPRFIKKDYSLPPLPSTLVVWWKGEVGGGISLNGGSLILISSEDWEKFEFDISNLNTNTLEITLLPNGMPDETYAYIDDIMIYEFKGPVAEFTVDEPRVGPPGTIFQFHDLTNSTYNITNWYWEFGDFKTSTAQNPTHAYSSPGFYDVSLTVSNPQHGTGETTIKGGYIVVTGDQSHPNTAPKYVKFQVFSPMGAPVSGVNISANFIESSGPLDWFFEWLGLAKNIDFENTTLKGTSGSDGSVNFLMQEEIKYAVHFEKPDVIDLTKYYYPKEDRYVIITSVDGPGKSDWYEKKYDVNRWIKTSISKDDDMGVITAYYDDILLVTNNVTVTYYQMDTAGNKTVLETKVIENEQAFNTTYTLNPHKGQSCFVSFDISHDVYGDVLREYGLSFKNFVDPLNLTDRFGAETANWAYMLVGVFMIIFIGLCFDAFSVAQGMGLIATLGWILVGLGWFNPLGGVIYAALILVSVLAVLGLIMQRKQQEGWQ